MAEDCRKQLEAIFSPALRQIPDAQEYERTLKLLEEIYFIYTNHREKDFTGFSSTQVYRCMVSLYEECFADLMAILILNMGAKEYFNIFVQSAKNQDVKVTELTRTTVMLRLLAVHNTILRGGDELALKWQTQLKEENCEEWEQIAEHAEKLWYKICKKNIENTYEDDLFNIGNALQDKTVINHLMEYLLACKETFMRNMNRKEYSYARDLITEMQACFNMPDSVEAQIIQMEKVISSYREKVLQ